MKKKSKISKTITESKDDRPLLELVMIVKNAESVIIPTLKTVKKYIDYFTILDTGSTDNTVSIISQEMSDCKGNIYQEPFVDFSTSRNRALELVGGRCKFTLFLDDTYHLHGGDRLREILKSKGKDNDCFDIRIFNPEEKKIYYSTRILATKAGYRYKYRVHEIPDTKYPGYPIKNEDIYLSDHDNIFTHQRSKARFVRDITGLEKDLKDYPNDTRVIYYLGMTNVMLENYEEARKWMLKYISKHRSRDEYLYHTHYNLALVLYRLRKDWKEIEDNLKKAIDIFPNRAEPYYKIASNYYREGDVNNAYSILKHIRTFPIPYNFNMDVEMDIYNVKIPYLYIETSMILASQGMKIDSKEIDKLLERMISENPSNYQFLNIREMIKPSSTSSITKYNNTKTVVIYTSFFQNQIWDPKEFRNSLVSGSEIMARNLAVELSRFGYKTFLFGNFKNSETDYQCNIEGVEFIDNSEYLTWVKSHYIHYLIVSRFPTNILYLPNIEKVYLWMHDVYPDYEYIQAHKTKFKGVLALCNWHRKLLMKEFNIPEEMVKITRNAIYPERFLNKDVEKVRNRFIWASDPSRGLKYLLQMMPKIKENIPEASLHIFANKNLISDTDLKFIEENDYIHLEGRKSQEEIALEYLKSDFWLYPTDFEETYCITAVEAQLAGCMCITLDIGSLNEIVGDRGVVIKGKADDEKTISQLYDYLFLLAEEPDIKEEFTSKAREWAIKQDYRNLAIEWSRDVLN